MMSSHCELHNSVHYIILVIFERPNGLGPTDVRLRHDEFHILVFHSRFVDLLILRFFCDRRHRCCRVAGSTVSSWVDFLEFLSGRNLGLSGQIFNFSFAKYNVCVAYGVLVYVWLVYDKKYVLGFAYCHPADTLNLKAITQINI